MFGRWPFYIFGLADQDEEREDDQAVDDQRRDYKVHDTRLLLQSGKRISRQPTDYLAKRRWSVNGSDAARKIPAGRDFEFSIFDFEKVSATRDIDG
jgi:hypothetical protein